MKARVDGEKFVLQCEERAIRGIRKFHRRLHLLLVSPKINPSPTENERRQTLLVADELDVDLDMSNVI